MTGNIENIKTVIFNKIFKMDESFDITPEDESGTEIHTVCNEGDTLTSTNRNQEIVQFDIVVGHIEDIIIEEFHHLQTSFMDRYWHEFDNSEENKLVYTDIFNEYIIVIERFIERRLIELLPGFSMSNFLRDLIQKKDSLDGEVFEVLYTFSDFIAFKEMFLDYKAMKEGTAVDFSNGITITPISLEED
ncbi:ADP-ribosylation factor-like protein 2-binding protein isoform X2 [Lycorma delicatula]|uniref:ADP-ribosylation factor-like protein 2-binding protein isoform X2 n=1 Tax=Lycorma delicatula TaxID=130591 RepID=UPI003F511BB2